MTAVRLPARDEMLARGRKAEVNKNRGRKAHGPTDDWPDALPVRHRNDGRSRRRPPTPLVEAIPCVEAVYDADAVSHRIRQAILESTAQASMTGPTKFTDNVEIRQRKRSRKTNISDLANPTNLKIDSTKLQEISTFRVTTETQASKPNPKSPVQKSNTKKLKKNQESLSSRKSERKSSRSNRQNAMLESSEIDFQGRMAKDWNQTSFEQSSLNLDRQETQSQALDYTYSRCQRYQSTNHQRNEVNDESTSSSSNVRISPSHENPLDNHGKP